MKDVEQFLKEGEYSGRRLSTELDDNDIQNIIDVIVLILKENPDKIQNLSNFSHDKEFSYVDISYYKPIWDFLVYSGKYKRIYQIPCPACKGEFIVDKESSYDLKTHKRCDSCGHLFDILDTSYSSFLGLPQNYYDTLDFTFCLVKQK